MLPHIFVRMGALTQAARQGLSAKIRFASANIVNAAMCLIAKASGIVFLPDGHPGHAP